MPLLQKKSGNHGKLKKRKENVTPYGLSSLRPSFIKSAL